MPTGGFSGRSGRSASGGPLVYARSATSQGRVIVQGVEFDEIQEKVGRSGGFEKLDFRASNKVPRWCSGTRHE